MNKHARSLAMGPVPAMTLGALVPFVRSKTGSPPTRSDTIRKRLPVAFNRLSARNLASFQPSLCSRMNISLFLPLLHPLPLLHLLLLVNSGCNTPCGSEFSHSFVEGRMKSMKC